MAAIDSVPSDYRIAEGPPDVDSFLDLRSRAGLTPRRADQAIVAIGGSWAAVHVVHEPTGETVGMGRLIGDGGLNFEVVDMAVLPEHQRMGLGDAILTFLLDRIRASAPTGAFVSLLADPPGRPLYAKHGFHETAPVSVGMATVLA